MIVYFQLRSYTFRPWSYTFSVIVYFQHDRILLMIVYFTFHDRILYISIQGWTTYDCNKCVGVKWSFFTSDIKFIESEIDLYWDSVLVQIYPMQIFSKTSSRFSQFMPVIFRENGKSQFRNGNPNLGVYDLWAESIRSSGWKYTIF